MGESAFKLVKKPPLWGANEVIMSVSLFLEACELLYMGTKNGKWWLGGKDEVFHLSMMTIKLRCKRNNGAASKFQCVKGIPMLGAQVKARGLLLVGRNR